VFKLASESLSVSVAFVAAHKDGNKMKHNALPVMV